MKTSKWQQLCCRPNMVKMGKKWLLMVFIGFAVLQIKSTQIQLGWLVFHSTVQIHQIYKRFFFQILTIECFFRINNGVLCTLKVRMFTLSQWLNVKMSFKAFESIYKCYWSHEKRFLTQKIMYIIFTLFWDIRRYLP